MRQFTNATAAIITLYAAVTYIQETIRFVKRFTENQDPMLLQSRLDDLTLLEREASQSSEQWANSPNSSWVI